MEKQNVIVTRHNGEKITNLSISALILTKDNYILYGRRSSSFAFSHIMKQLKNKFVYEHFIKYLYKTEILKILRSQSINFMDLKEYIIRKKIIGSDSFDNVLIGGHKISLSESSVDTLLREMKEEINIEYNDIEELYDIGNVVIYDTRFKNNYFNHVFVVVSNLTKRSIVNKFYSNFELHSISFIPYTTIAEVIKYYLYYITKILQIN